MYRDDFECIQLAAVGKIKKPTTQIRKDTNIFPEKCSGRSFREFDETVFPLAFKQLQILATSF